MSLTIPAIKTDTNYKENTVALVKLSCPLLGFTPNSLKFSFHYPTPWITGSAGSYAASP